MTSNYPSKRGDSVVIFASDDLTTDGFLDGRLTILQPHIGYRAATDPVFLAASIPAKSGQTALELGCGAGVASLCLAHRVTELSLVGVEVQAAYADLARRNAAKNRLPLDVVDADLAALPKCVAAQNFDHVFANPPYLGQGQGTPARDWGKERAFREETELAVWIATGFRRLKQKGSLTLIHLAERLPDILSAMAASSGEIIVKPLAPRANKPARRVIVRAKKGGAGGFKLLAPLVIHDGLAHEGDRDSTSRQAAAILRDGRALEL